MARGAVPFRCGRASRPAGAGFPRLSRGIVVARLVGGGRLLGPGCAESRYRRSSNEGDSDMATIRVVLLVSAGYLLPGAVAGAAFFPVLAPGAAVLSGAVAAAVGAGAARSIRRVDEDRSDDASGDRSREALSVRGASLLSSASVSSRYTRVSSPADSRPE